MFLTYLITASWKVFTPISGKKKLSKILNKMRTPNKSHNFIENSEQKKFSAEFYFHLGECLT